MGSTLEDDRRALPLWRRAALASVAAWLTACGGPPGIDARYDVIQLADGVALVAGPDGNVVAARGADGLLVINGGRAANAEALMGALAAATGEREIATLVTTDWRPEHVGLNAIAGGRGAEIVAHFNAGQWLAYGATDLATGEVYEPLPEAARPTRLIGDEGGEVALGDGAVELGYLMQAHTDSDLYAYFPAANVLVTGDVVRSDGWSMVHWPSGGYMGGLEDALEVLVAVGDDDTVVVPGSGPVMTKADLAAQAETYTDMFMRVAELVLSSQSPAEAVEARPTGGYHPEWTDADEFVERAHRSYRTHLRRDPRLPAIP